MSGLDFGTKDWGGIRIHAYHYVTVSFRCLTPILILRSVKTRLHHRLGIEAPNNAPSMRSKRSTIPNAPMKH